MVAIKDMKMPKECWQCRFTYEDCNGYTTCSLTGKILYPMGKRDTRPDECPLIEIGGSDI